MIQVRVYNLLDKVHIVTEGSEPTGRPEAGPWRWSTLDNRSFEMPTDDLPRILALHIHEALVNVEGYAGWLKDHIEA